MNSNLGRLDCELSVYKMSTHKRIKWATISRRMFWRYLDRALIVLAAPDESLAHDGMSPQRISDNSRASSMGFWRMAGMDWWGNVVPGNPVLFTRNGIEVFLDNLLSPG